MVTATKQEYGFQVLVPGWGIYDSLMDRCPSCGTQKPAQAFQDTVFGPLRWRALEAGVEGHEHLSLTRDGRWYRATFWFYATPEQHETFKVSLDGLQPVPLQDGVEFNQPVEFTDAPILDGTFAAEMRDALLSLREKA